MRLTHLPASVRQALVIALVALAPALVCGGLQLQWKAEVPLAPGEIRPATARQWGDKVFWADARNAARYEAGHIPGAVRLTEEEWELLVPKFLDAWDPDRTVVVYCDGGSCEASKEVSERLRREMKIESYVLKGGWPAWQRGD